MSLMSQLMLRGQSMALVHRMGPAISIMASRHLHHLYSATSKTRSRRAPRMPSWPGTPSMPGIKLSQLQPYRNYVSDVEDLKTKDPLNNDQSALQTGVIDVSKGSEIILFFDHIYPLSLSKYSLQYFKLILMFSELYSDENIRNRLWLVALPKEFPLPNGVAIVEYIPLKRDGGAFVKFVIPLPLDPNDIAIRIVNNVQKKKSLLSNWEYLNYTIWNTFPKTFPVRGTPWIEDLSRFPSFRLKVQMEGEQLSEEEIYLTFRRYGPIIDIIPPLKDNAYVTVSFRHVRSAVAAKNCVTGMEVELLDGKKTSMHIQYIPFKRANVIFDFIVEHQRILIPIMFAILAAVAVVIFDPIRQWFIEKKISHAYELGNSIVLQTLYTPYRAVLNWITDLYDFLDSKMTKCNDLTELADLDVVSSNQDETADLWYERYERAKQLKLWIYENNSTFIIVKGPKGSGKLEFVLDYCLANDPALRKQVLYIDCESIVKARTDSAMLKALAHQLGYFPLFTWTRLISNFIDLGTQGLTGQKLGLAELKEQQVKSMFLLSIPALRSVALKDYENYKSAVLRRKRQLEKSNKEKGSSTPSPEEQNLDELLNSDALLKQDQYLQQHPEFKPIIVINKFVRKSDSPNDFIYQMIAEWAALAVQSNVANVIFITHDVGSLPLLNDALPNQVFKTISLLDALKISLQKFVCNQLPNSVWSDELSDNHKILDECLEPIGGRMLDLQSFVRRIKSGENPREALDEMISQAAEQLSTFFLNRQTGQSPDLNWLAAQVWIVMKILSDKEEISFVELSKNPLLKPLLETLQTLVTLEKHDVILIKRDKGVVVSVLTGRPLFRAAFQALTSDIRVSRLYDTDYYGTLILLENAKIQKLEDELAKLKHLAGLSMLKLRVEYIQKKISDTTQKIVDYETTVANLGKPPADDRSWSLLGK